MSGALFWALDSTRCVSSVLWLCVCGSHVCRWRAHARRCAAVRRGRPSHVVSNPYNTLPLPTAPVLVERGVCRGLEVVWRVGSGALVGCARQGHSGWRSMMKVWRVARRQGLGARYCVGGKRCVSSIDRASYTPKYPTIQYFINSVV